MENVILKEATFNPKVKTYIFLVVIFYLVISFVGLLILPIWLLGLGQWLSNMFFHTLKCQLSYKNLKFSRGIIFRVEKTIPLENIQDLAFIGGPILRSFGLTIIKVETAGGGGQHHSNMMSMIGINDSEEFKDMILKQREIIVKEKAMGFQRPANAEASGNENILNEIRDELIKIRKVLMTQSLDSKN
jgi:putative membrane protein